MQAIFEPAVNDSVFLDYNPARNYDIAREHARLQAAADRRTDRAHQQAVSGRTAAKRRSPRSRRTCRRLPRESEDKRTPAQQAAGIAENDEDHACPTTKCAPPCPQADTERLHAIAKRLLQMFTGYGRRPCRRASSTWAGTRREPSSPCAAIRTLRAKKCSPAFLSALGGGDVPEAPLHADIHVPPQSAGRVGRQRRTTRCSPA